MNRILCSGTQVGTRGRSYHSDRVAPLMVAIKRELEMFQNIEISYNELGRWAGQAASTAFDKLQKAKQPQIEALLRWLERLPVSKRDQLVNGACRCFPTLKSPRFSHDPAQVGRIRTLLHRGPAITVIRGCSESARTFFATALGHDFETLNGGCAELVAGMDVHEPDWFVPLEDVVYFPNAIGASLLCENIRRTWSFVTSNNSKFYIFNGIWNTAQDLHPKLAQLATRAHVVIVDDLRTEPERFSAGLRAHWLTVSEEADHRIRIASEIVA